MPTGYWNGLSAAERVAAEIASSGGRASAFRQDTAKPADSEKVVNYAVDTYGALHYAVNNAGIGGPSALRCPFSISAGSLPKILTPIMARKPVCSMTIRV